MKIIKSIIAFIIEIILFTIGAVFVGIDLIKKNPVSFRVLEFVNRSIDIVGEWSEK